MKYTKVCWYNYKFWDDRCSGTDTIQVMRRLYRKTSCGYHLPVEEVTWSKYTTVQLGHLRQSDRYYINTLSKWVCCFLCKVCHTGAIGIELMCHFDTKCVKKVKFIYFDTPGSSITEKKIKPNNYWHRVCHFWHFFRFK